MTLIQLLEAAWRNKDWALVDEAYKSLTGMSLDNNVTHAHIITDEIQQPSLNDNVYNDGHTVIVKDTKPVKSNSSKQAQPQKLKLGTFQNKFVDDKRIARNDRKFDKIVWKDREPTPRRNKAPQCEVDCKKCNKTYTIYEKDLPPMIGGEQSTYICNKCLKV